MKHLKILNVFVLFIFIFFAELSNSEPVKFFYAKPGYKEFIDIKNQSIVHVLFDSKSQSSQQYPTANLISQWSGFECTHVNTELREQFYNVATKEYLSTWELQFKFTPGADLSGCIYHILFPGYQKAIIELFMNY